MAESLVERSDSQPEIVNLTAEAATELSRIYEVSGYRFKDAGMAPLSLDKEDGSLWLTDDYQASLLVDCVAHSAALSQSLYDAHDAALVAARIYGRSSYNNEQLERVRNSKELCLDRVEIARSIGRQITKTFELPAHDFTGDPSIWHQQLVESRTTRRGY